MKRIICILLLSALFLACVPTPEEEFIVSKSDNLAEQKILSAAVTEETVAVEKNDSEAPSAAPLLNDTAAPVKAQTFPTRWDEDTVPIREYVTLAIHADVESRADGVYPVYKTRSGTLTSEDVAALANRLLRKPTEMSYLDAMTKEEWGRQLKEYVDTVAAWQEWVDAGRPEIEGHDDTDFTPEEVEATTAWLMEQIRNAPEQIETKKVSDYSGYHINETVRYTLQDGGTAVISSNNKQAWSTYVQISNLCENAGYIYYAYQYEADRREGADADMKKSAALWQEPTLSREDAETIVYRELEKLGFSDFRIAFGEKAMLLDVGENIAPRRAASGWGFRLNRNYEGYPLIDVLYKPSDLLNYGDDDAFAVNEPIREEKITVFVDENGIQSFAYSCPKEIVGKANANVELLPFEKIQRIVKNTMSVCYPLERYQGSADWQWKLEVYRMVLTTYTLHVRNSDEFYEMPCWVVLFDGWFGQEERATQNVRMQSIVINAIDGTVVHEKQGY